METRGKKKGQRVAPRAKARHNYRFTTEKWQKMLSELNGTDLTDEGDLRRAEGIAEFRKMFDVM